MIKTYKIDIDSKQKFSSAISLLQAEIKNNSDLSNISMIINLSNLLSHKYLADVLQPFTNCAYLNNEYILDHHIKKINLPIYSFKKAAKPSEYDKNMLENTYENGVFQLNKLPEKARLKFINLSGATIQQKRWMHKIKSSKVLIITDKWDKKYDFKIDRLIKNYDLQAVYIYQISLILEF